MHPRVSKLLEGIRSAAEFVKSTTDGLVLQKFKQNRMLRQTVTRPLEIYTAERMQEFDVAEAELAAVLAQMPVKP
jgi:uncharacterized protein with HEPN domain